MVLAGPALRLLQALGVDLLNLDLDLRDAPPRAGDPRLDVARPTFEPCRLAFQLQQSVERNHPLREQGAPGFEPPGDEPGLAFHRDRLGPEAGDLPAGLPDPLPKLCLAARARRSPGIEQPLLAVEDFPNGRFACGNSGQLRIPSNALRIAELGFQPVAPRDELDVLRVQRRLVGAQERVVEPDQRLARLHAVALAHQDFLDRAAVDVLDDLVAGLDLDLTGGDHRPGNRGDGAPTEQPTPEQG